MSEWCARWNVEMWAYCLMPNHVHMIAVPVSGEGNGLVRVKPLREMVGTWRDFLLSGVLGDELDRIRRHEGTGRPVGNDGFVETLEQALGRILTSPEAREEKGAEPEMSMVSPN